MCRFTHINTRIAIIGAGFVFVLLGLQHTDAGPSRPEVDTTIHARGVLRMTNSRHGKAILTVSNLKPGSRAKGRVYIRNNGTVAGHFTMHPRHLVDHPGPFGGQLSQVLNLRIRSWSKSKRIYRGPFAATPDIALGKVRPHRGRVFVFKIHFPQMPPQLANPYKGSRTTVEYLWTATT